MKRLLLFIVLCLTLPAALNAQREDPALRVGILSDVHVGINSHELDSIFVKVLEFYRMKDIDAMIIVGDFVNDGLEEEMANIAKDWFSVFPDDKGLKGKHVERIFVYGNHEIDGHTYNNNEEKYGKEYIEKYNIAAHREEYWEKYFREPFTPFYRKEVNGYTFLAAHYNQRYETPGMAEFFAQEEDTFPDVDKPIFYIQHKHPKWTIPWAPDNGESTRILKNYPNLICFSGHCHMSLTDEKSIWQGSFTSVNTASLKRTGVRGNRENGNLSEKQKQEGVVLQMNQNWCGKGHQGMLMLVYNDRVDLERYDFHNDDLIGVWSIPTDVSKRPYDPEIRKAHGELYPPVFGKKSYVSIKKALGKDRNGTPTKQVQVFFPVAVSSGEHPRALDYSVSVECQDADSTVTVFRKLVYSPYYYMCEKYDKALEGKCFFSEEELPKGVPFRFAVRPRDSFDNEGGAIYSKYMKL